MKTHDAALATRPWNPTVKIMMADGQGVVFGRYGALWRQLRKICILELLSPRRVQSFRGIREDEVGRLVAAVAAAPPGEPVNVSERIAVLITDSAVRAMIGDRFKKREEFLQILEEGVKLVSGFTLGDLFPSSWLAGFISGTARLAQENHRKCFDLMDYAIKQHEEQRAAAAAKGAVEEGEDLVEVLLRVQKEGGLEVPLTMGIIKAVILVSITTLELVCSYYCVNSSFFIPFHSLTLRFLTSLRFWRPQVNCRQGLILRFIECNLLPITCAYLYLCRIYSVPGARHQRQHSSGRCQNL
jgi:hypothetical protein